MCLPKTMAPGILSETVNSQDSAAVPTPGLQRELEHVLLIDVAGYSKLVREEKQP
jgi:hypothetical protein